MKRIIIASTLAVFALSGQAFAADNCADALVKVDTALETTKAGDDAKMKIMALRDQGAKAAASGDEKACTEAASAALKLLAK